MCERRLSDTQLKAAAGMTGVEVTAEIIQNLGEHEDRRSHSLNLIASENSVSPMARKVLDSDLANRYSVGPSVRWFPGLEEYTKIETRAIEMLKDTTDASYVNVQPTSGMLANLTAYHAMINKGDSVLTVDEKHGGHYSHRGGNNGNGKKADTLLDQFGVKSVDYLPFDVKEYNLDVGKSIKMIKEVEPDLVIVGASEMLFPAPIEELRDAIDSDRNLRGKTQILYDAAHVFGLIVGGEFQKPIPEGADMISSSTNKTLGTPCHGMVAFQEDPKYPYRSEYRKGVEHALVPMYTSNHHAQEVASLAITMAEMKTFGKDYAGQVIRNAQALGKALADRGINVLAAHKGFTQSHEVLIDTSNLPKPLGVERKATYYKDELGQANIMLSCCALPSDTGDARYDGICETGLRVGTNEMTRFGMREPEMERTASLISTILKQKNHSCDVTDGVKKQIRDFREEFKTQIFCFKPEDFVKG